jgi:hypothetical protein
MDPLYYLTAGCSAGWLHAPRCWCLPKKILFSINFVQAGDISVFHLCSQLTHAVYFSPTSQSLFVISAPTTKRGLSVRSLWRKKRGIECFSFDISPTGNRRFLFYFYFIFENCQNECQFLYRHPRSPMSHHRTCVPSN